MGRATATLLSMKIDGASLEAKRANQFLSRAELARRAGITPDHLGQIERGNWSGGSRLDTIRRLAEALGCEPQELILSE